MAAFLLHVNCRLRTAVPVSYTQDNNGEIYILKWCSDHLHWTDVSIPEVELHEMKAKSLQKHHISRLYTMFLCSCIAQLNHKRWLLPQVQNHASHFLSNAMNQTVARLQGRGFSGNFCSNIDQRGFGTKKTKNNISIFFPCRADTNI